MAAVVMLVYDTVTARPGLGGDVEQRITCGGNYGWFSEEPWAGRPCPPPLWEPVWELNRSTTPWTPWGPLIADREALPVTGSTYTHMKLDPGVLAAAIGPIEIKIKRRLLIVTLGVVCAEDEMVMLRPARSTDDLYSSVTDTEREQAIARFRSQEHRLKSPLLKGSAKFHSAMQCWCVNGTPWYDMIQHGLTTEVPTHPSPCRSTDYRQFLRVTGDGLVTGAKQAVRETLDQVSKSTRLRVLSLLRQQFEEVAMPTPSLSGKIGADQLSAYPFDADVYKLLVKLSRLVPGALRPVQVPKFKIPNSVLVRMLEGWIATYTVQPSHDDHADTWTSPKWNGSASTMKGALKLHQRDAVADMVERDSRGAPGHFLVMDVGFGKTLTSLYYATQFLWTSNGKQVQYILWTTPGHIVESTENQIRSKWGAPTNIVSRASGHLVKYAVNIIDQDYLRVLVGQFVHLAISMFIVFDEVDQLYGNTLRTSAARQLAQLCPKMVCQTATPMTSTKDERLAQWLSSTELYPVTRSNWLVAANGMVSKQIDLGIDVKYHEIFIDLTDNVRQAHLNLKDNWLEMAKVTQDACNAALVETAIKYVKEGVLLVANSEDHAEVLLSALRSRSVAAGGFESLSDPSKDIICVTKRQNRGYNEAVRLGVIVTGVYASNAASRHQLTGRLLRMGQKRSAIVHVTLTMKNSILELLHFRHKNVDTMNISLQKLGDMYGREVLDGLA